MTRRHLHQRVGTAFVLVVGVVSVLSILGMSFIIISHMHAKQAKRIEASAQVDPAGPAVLALLRARAAADLYIDDDDNGPYHASGVGVTLYADYPSEEIDPWLSVAYHHAQPESDQAFFGKLPAEVSLDGGGNPTLVDTDGDEEPDAYQFSMGIYDDKGREYFAAARVYDASALLNVNTACQGPNLAQAWTLTSPTAPANVDLRSLIGSANYNTLHADRCGGTTNVTLQEYTDQLARRVLYPEPGEPDSTNNHRYLPFGTGDETMLRWLKDPTSYVNHGRLWDVAQNLNLDGRRFLTTYSVSRQRVRYPDADADPSKDFTKLLNLRDLDLTNGDDRTKLYQRTLRFVEQLRIGGQAPAQPQADDLRKRLAAHFVANLWAYQSSGDTGAPWEFRPSGENFSAYGLKQDLVITEAWAFYQAKTAFTPDSEDDHWAYAIEIMNPSGQNIDLGNYKLTGIAGDPTLPSITVNADGGKVVLYNFGRGDKSTASSADAGLPNPIPASWRAVGDLTFSGGEEVTLMRVYGGTEVPVDRVTAGDLEFDLTTVTPGTKYISDARRDDRLTHARYNVAAWLLAKGDTATNELGSDNGFPYSPDPLSGLADFSVPILRHGAAIDNLGELGRIYWTGPRRNHTSNETMPFPLAIMTDELEFRTWFPDDPARGRLNLHPTNESYSIPAGGWASGTYPDVPAGALLSEYFTLLTPDPTRPDDATRIYGKVNVNTAPLAVLERLPWPDPTTITFRGVTLDSLGFSPAAAAMWIYHYRERMGSHNYGSGVNVTENYGSHAGGSGVPGLRSGTNYDGMLSVGEVAIPLADYLDSLLEAQGLTEADYRPHAEYVDYRDSLYRAISNTVTARSDSYLATIRVFLRDPEDGDKIIRSWYYVAAIDRSNCTETGHTPAVLMFTPVK